MFEIFFKIFLFFDFEAPANVQGWDNRICDRANPSKVSARARDNIPSNNSVNKVTLQSLAPVLFSLI